MRLVDCSCSKCRCWLQTLHPRGSALGTSLWWDVINVQATNFVLLQDGGSTASCVRREPSSVTALTGSSALEGCAGGDGRGEEEALSFKFSIPYTPLSFFSLFSPYFSFPPASSPPLVSFHLLFLDLPAIIWLSQSFWHIWILLQPLMVPPHLLLCMLCFSSLHILPRSSDHL